MRIRKSERLQFVMVESKGNANDDVAVLKSWQAVSNPTCSHIATRNIFK